MTRPVLTVAACWAVAVEMLPPDTPADIRRFLRQTFYAGAAGTVNLVRGGVSLDAIMAEAVAAAREAIAKERAP